MKKAFIMGEDRFDPGALQKPFEHPSRGKDS
jgi:hypothetical protein